MATYLSPGRVMSSLQLATVTVSFSRYFVFVLDGLLLWHTQPGDVVIMVDTAFSPWQRLW